MVDSFVQVPPDSAGKKLRTGTRVVGSETVHEEYVIPIHEDGSGFTDLARETGNLAAIKVQTDKLQFDLDGKLKVAVGDVVCSLDYNEVSLGPDIESTVVTFIASQDSYLFHIHGNSNSTALFIVKVDGTPILKGRTSAAELNWDYNAAGRIKILTGSTVEIVARNTGYFSAKYAVTLLTA